MQIQQKSATPNVDPEEKKEKLTNGFHSTEKFEKFEENAENDEILATDGAEV